MAGTEATAALELLLEADVESMDRRGLDDVLLARRVVCAVTDAVDVRIARRARQLAEQGESETAAEVLRERGRRSAQDAGTAARREQTCARLPSFESALAAGAVSGGHLDVLTNATANLSDEQTVELVEHEPTLLADAARSSVETFERHCRDLVRQLAADDGAGELAAQRRRNRIRRWVDQVSGMHHLHAELDPESAAKVWSAILAQLRSLQREQRAADPPAPTPAAVVLGFAGPSPSTGPADTLTHDQLEAQAFIDLVTGARALDRRTPEVIVLIDWDTLVTGLHEQSLCETADGTPLPPAVVRRLCCDADIVPVVLGGDAEVLDVGRGRRLATAAQRRALWAMYRTCGFPDCRTPIERCEIHHVREWSEHNGGTDLANLLPLCVRHHHSVHDGGWNLTLGECRVITVTRPDGTTHHHGPTTNRAPPRPTAPAA